MTQFAFRYELLLNRKRNPAATYLTLLKGLQQFIDRMERLATEVLISDPGLHFPYNTGELITLQLRQNGTVNMSPMSLKVSMEHNLVP